MLFRSLQAFWVGAGLALLSVALGGLTDDVVFNIPTSILLWMLLALTAASVSIEEEIDGTIALGEKVTREERDEREGM